MTIGLVVFGGGVVEGLARSVPPAEEDTLSRLKKPCRVFCPATTLRFGPSELALFFLEVRFGISGGPARRFSGMDGLGLATALVWVLKSGIETPDIGGESSLFVSDADAAACEPVMSLDALLVLTGTWVFIAGAARVNMSRILRRPSNSGMRRAERGRRSFGPQSRMRSPFWNMSSGPMRFERYSTAPSRVIASTMSA
jgi:hypothetical protein